MRDSGGCLRVAGNRSSDAFANRVRHLRLAVPWQLVDAMRQKPLALVERAERVQTKISLVV